MTGFGLGKNLILSIEKMRAANIDPNKFKLESLRGAAIAVKTGTTKGKPIEIGFIRDIFLNPREGVYAEITFAGEFEVEVDDKGTSTGVFFTPGPF